MIAGIDTGTVVDWVDGEPRSRHYGDIYFSRARGLEETRHVFLDGNDLSRRFARIAARGTFTIGETGFGTGLNFLAAWHLFDAAAPADARLHFVSTELHPLSTVDLARALSLWPDLRVHADALLASYDALPPGFHRFLFASGRITLTLLVGDAASTLPLLDAHIDAWFLDGFAPSKNPGLWSVEVLTHISRLSHAGTTCATYTVAGVVRRGLDALGYRVERAPGFGTKREMLRGTCVQPGAVGYRPPWTRRGAVPSVRDAIVIGGGLAGASTAASLAARGIRVTLIDRGRRLADETSGNAQGMLYIKPSPHPTPLTALVVAGLAFTQRMLAAVLPSDGVAWSRCGVLSLAHDPAEADRIERIASLGWPAEFAHPVSRDEASVIAGVDLPVGGLFHPGAGWVHPPALCEALVASDGIRLRLGQRVDRIERTHAGRWCALADAEPIAEADVVVVAGGLSSRAFAQCGALPLRGIRGQITQVPATEASRILRTVLCAESYAAPAREGVHCIGATFDVHDEAPTYRAEDNRANLDALTQVSPAFAQALEVESLDAATLEGRAGVRCVTPDYLPVIGPVVDATAFAERFNALRHDAKLKVEGDVPWLSGLYVNTGHGSRGLVTAPLGGELIASLVAGEPSPLPEALVRALAPVRFAVRSLTRGRGNAREADGRKDS
jgi:tRNA 5-methylaminomethyl-2-thiouridine biosynthesis bifunctional protein